MRYACRLAADPVRGEEFRFLLAIGEGCCARFNTWRGDVKNRDEPGGRASGTPGQEVLPPSLEATAKP